VGQRVRQVILIRAPVEKVFAYLDEPENGLALVPQLVEVREVVLLPNGGHRLRFVALGRRGKLCEWLSETLERVPNQVVVVRAQTEGYTSTAVRRLDETPEGTRLSGEVEYHIDVSWPQKVLLPVMEFQARRPMRRQLRTVLELVKARVEADQGRAA
jgi:hypothetical protein